MTLLRPLSPDRYTWFFETAVANYAADNVRGGRWLADEAPAMARAETLRLLPQELATPDHFVCLVTDDSEQDDIGFIWYGAMQRGARKVAYVYSLHVEPRYRRRGYARFALAEVERIALQQGLSALVLTVFAHNVAAQSLYREAGLSVSTLVMTRPLDPRA